MQNTFKSKVRNKNVRTNPCHAFGTQADLRKARKVHALRRRSQRSSDPPIHYLVGTPKARLKRLEAQLTQRPWVEVRGQLRVKSLPQDGETYIYTESPARVDKERSMRRRALQAYWKRLRELSTLKQQIPRDDMLLRLGKAQEKAGRIASEIVEVEVTPDGRLVYQLNKYKLRETLFMSR